MAAALERRISFYYGEGVHQPICEYERVSEYINSKLLDLGEKPTPDVGNVSMCGLYLSRVREL